jgi:serine/threonine protein kinase
MGYSPVVQIGRYQILDQLGSGGMGEVYRALAQGVDGFQKPVVIKRIHKHLADRPDLATQFINEAKIAMSLLHGNVVQVLDLGKMDDEYYIAFEYIDGRDVRDLIRRCRELGEWIPQEIALHIVSSVLCGLDYAHRRTDLEGRPLAIIHRDVTPANILCSYEGEVKLADFGIARALNLQSETVPGGVKGSLRYMSPEQAFGRPLDQRADIFSVGVNLYFLLCGAHPYGEDNVFAVAQRVREVRFTPPSERGVALPDELESIVLTAMAADPDDRYPTAAAMLTALEGYQRTIAHATSSDLRAFMQRLFEPESQRRSWAVPAPDPVEGGNSLVGTEIEVLEGKEVAAPGARSGVRDRLRRALRVEAGPTVRGESEPLRAVPTASESGRSGRGRGDALAEATAATQLDLSSTSGARPERALPVEATATRESSHAVPGAAVDPSTTAARPGRASGLLLVVVVAVVTAGLALGVLVLATRSRGPAPSTPPGATAALAPARQGRLSIRSRPAGATVLLDGKPAGKAPLSVDLTLGREHQLELRGEGLEAWSEPVRLDPSAPIRTMVVELAARRVSAPQRPATVPAKRPPAAGKGWVVVSTRPAWAEVHVAGRKLDVTPCRVLLPAGPQILTLVNPQIPRTIRRRVVVRPDHEVELRVVDFK